MQSMSVQPAQLEAMSGEIRNDSNQIQSALDTLDGQVRQLIGAWEGEAQTMYHTAQRDWDNKIKELNELLNRISQKTAEIGAGYTSADQRGAANFGG